MSNETVAFTLDPSARQTDADGRASELSHSLLPMLEAETHETRFKLAINVAVTVLMQGDRAPADECRSFRHWLDRAMVLAMAAEKEPGGHG